VQGPQRRFRVLLAGIVAGGGILRVWSVLAWQRGFELHGDQVFYHHQANALADGFGYVNPYALQGAGWLLPTAAHPPVYSTYLALWSAVGIDTPPGHKLASCVLGMATVLLVGLVAHRIAGEAAGLAAATLAALAPNLWISDGGLVSEAAYGTSVALLLLAAHRAWRAPDTWAAVWLGLALALATLTRAEALVLFAFLAVPVLLVRRSTVPLAQRFRLLVICGATGAAALAPWVARNLTTFEHPVGVSVGAGYVLEIANCDDTYHGPLLGYWSQACDRSTWPEGDESTVELAKREVAMEHIRANTGRLPVVVAARVGRMWDVYRPSQGVRLNDFFERRGRLPSQLGLWFYWAMLPLGVLGAREARRRGAALSPYVAIAASVTLAAAMSFGITRYRAGAEVALCVLAGVGLAWLLEAVSARRAAPGEATT
jgi:hypothetical protein